MDMSNNLYTVVVRCDLKFTYYSACDLSCFPMQASSLSLRPACIRKRCRCMRPAINDHHATLSDHLATFALLQRNDSNQQATNTSKPRNKRQDHTSRTTESSAHIQRIKQDRCTHMLLARSILSICRFDRYMNICI